MSILLANVGAPYILNLTGNIVVVASIVPLEAVVLWLLWRKTMAGRFTILKSLQFSLFVNVITSILGIPFVWNFLFGPAPPLALFVLPICLIITIFVEGKLANSFFNKNLKEILPKGKRWVSIIAANTLSYVLFLFLLYPLLVNYEAFAEVTSGWGALIRADLESYQNNLLNSQIAYYIEHRKFAQNFSELGISVPKNQGIERMLDIVSDTTMKSRYIQLDMNVSPERVVLFPRMLLKIPIHLKTGVVFVPRRQEKYKLVSGFCRRSRKFAPAPDPQEINLTGSDLDIIICPPDSTLSNDYNYKTY